MISSVKSAFIAKFNCIASLCYKTGTCASWTNIRFLSISGSQRISVSDTDNHSENVRSATGAGSAQKQKLLQKYDLVKKKTKGNKFSSVKEFRVNL